MENKPRRVVILRGGVERTVEIDHGPFHLAANTDTEYYEGWLELEGQDPYGEPYLVVFAKEAILREV